MVADRFLRGLALQARQVGQFGDLFIIGARAQLAQGKAEACGEIGLVLAQRHLAHQRLDHEILLHPGNGAIAAQDRAQRFLLVLRLKHEVADDILAVIAALAHVQERERELQARGIGDLFLGEIGQQTPAQRDLVEPAECGSRDGGDIGAQLQRQAAIIGHVIA